MFFLFLNSCIDRNKKNISELFFFANLSELKEILRETIKF